MADSKQVELKLPQLEELLNAGVHFGHKKSAWNPKMKQYIYTERNGVHIIDLVSSMTMLKKATDAITEAANKGNILVVGTKGQAASLVQEMAESAGAFYVNKRWPGGLFTNFKAIKRSVDKLIKMEETLASGATDLVKKEQLLMKRDVDRLNQIYSGIKFMDRTPALMIVIDSKVEKNAIREARNENIPIVALVDTNSDPTVIDFPVPANDDSIKSLNLFINVFGEAIKSGTKATALVALRRDNEARLTKTRSDFEAEIEKRRLMDEQERERIKALKEGKDVEKVMRVVSKSADEKPAKVVRATAKPADEKPVKVVRATAKPRAKKASK